MALQRSACGRRCPPAARDQLGLREGAPGSGSQAGEQDELAPRQAQLDTVKDGATSAGVQRQRSDRQPLGAAALDRAHARTQLRRAQRSDQHRVGAGVESGRGGGAARGDHDERGQRVGVAQPLDVDSGGRDDQGAMRLRLERMLDLSAQAGIAAGDAKTAGAGAAQGSSTSRGAMPRPSRAISASVSV